MILYCYKCLDCGKQWEDWRSVSRTKSVTSAKSDLVDGSEPGKCIYCKSDNTGRDYQTENKALRPDWKPGFNTSIGMPFSGRRDLLSKMKGAGLQPYGEAGGVNTSTGLNKRLYGEEQYQDEVIHAGAGFDHEYNELLNEGIRTSGTPDGEEHPEMMRKVGKKSEFRKRFF